MDCDQEYVPEFGNIIGHFASITHNNNQLSTDIQSGLDGRRGNGFSRRHGPVGGHDGVADGLIQDIVISGLFGIGDGSGHDLNGGFKVGRVGGFSRQHDGIGPIVDGIGDIGTFGTGRPGIGDHTFEHLGGNDHGLSGNVAFANHPLLCQKDFGTWNFHAQISPSHHDPIGFLQNVIKILQTFLVFNLANDLDVSTVVVMQEFLEILDIGSGTNKGGGDEFDSSLDPKVDNVTDILVGKGGKIDLDTWKILVTEGKGGM